MTQNDNIVTHAAQANLPTRYGDFTLHIFRDGQGAEHMAVIAGAPQEGALVRLHSECATGDIWSLALRLPRPAGERFARHHGGWRRYCALSSRS